MRTKTGARPVGANGMDCANRAKPVKWKTTKPTARASRFQTRHLRALLWRPAWSSVAKTPVKSTPPMSPLKAEARAARSYPAAADAGSLSFERTNAEISLTSTPSAPSGPTEAPEERDASDEMNAPGNAR